jgi:uncharacterized membrane protein
MSSEPISTPPLDLTRHPSVGLRAFLLRALFSLGITALLVFLSFGGNWSQVLASYSHANLTPHAPNLSVLNGVSPAIQIHLATVLAAVAIGAILLLGPKGTTFHRTLGWGWATLMVVTAVAAFFIREVNHGALSFIHILAGATLITAPLGVYFARTHRVLPHGRTMQGLFAGGILIAGILAFLPGRIMWRMFFG